MRSSTRYLPALAVLSALGLLAGGATGVEGQPAAVGYAIEVDIVPDLERNDAYQAEAVVTELGTDRVLARPRVRFLREQLASAQKFRVRLSGREPDE